MKCFITWVVSILILISSIHSQNIEKSKKVNMSATTSQISISRGNLTSLSGLPNGPVFVGGYAVKEGSDYSMKGLPLLWKIKDSTIALRQLKAPYEIDECLWFDERTGWCYALGKGIYKTTDGGANWIKESYVGSKEFFFLDKTHGWYFDSNLLMGIEGEKTNKLARIDVKYIIHVKKLQFVSVDIGWLLDVVDGKSRFQKSDDGGKSWKLVDAPFSDVDSFQFSTERVGYVSTPEGLYATVNGGYSWTMVLDNAENEWIDKVFFLSPDVGWVYGNRICMTMNGGQEWKCEKRPGELDGDTIKGFIFTNESSGWLLVDNRLFYTNDGGRVWKRKILSFRTVNF